MLLTNILATYFSPAFGIKENLPIPKLFTLNEVIILFFSSNIFPLASLTPKPSSFFKTTPTVFFTFDKRCPLSGKNCASIRLR